MKYISNGCDWSINSQINNNKYCLSLVLELLIGWSVLIVVDRQVISLSISAWSVKLLRLGLVGEEGGHVHCGLASSLNSLALHLVEDVDSHLGSVLGRLHVVSVLVHVLVEATQPGVSSRVTVSHRGS